MAVVSLKIGSRFYKFSCNDGQEVHMKELADMLDKKADQLTKSLLSIPKRREITSRPPRIEKAERVCSIRDAMLAQSETVSVSMAVGCVLASTTLSCPPAIPIIVSGERITENALQLFEYYGINNCDVIK